jgi:hypothetical protein
MGWGEVGRGGGDERMGEERGGLKGRMGGGGNRRGAGEVGGCGRGGGSNDEKGGGGLMGGNGEEHIPNAFAPVWILLLE